MAVPEGVIVDTAVGALTTHATLVDDFTTNIIELRVRGRHVERLEKRLLRNLPVGRADILRHQ